MPTKIKYQDSILKTLHSIVARATDRTVVVSPLLRTPSDGTSAWQEFFMVITKPFTITQVIVDPDEGAEWRALFVSALAKMGEGKLTIIEPDEELATARMCEGLWPCAAATRVREGIEQENARHA